MDMLKPMGRGSWLHYRGGVLSQIAVLMSEWSWNIARKSFRELAYGKRATRMDIVRCTQRRKMKAPIPSLNAPFRNRRALKDPYAMQTVLYVVVQSLAAALAVARTKSADIKKFLWNWTTKETLCRKDAPNTPVRLCSSVTRTTVELARAIVEYKLAVGGTFQEIDADSRCTIFQKR
ncbi:hypothetical protein ARMGADRAFT_1028314 [Armillaria gallica]|uniref:Uncharacterized protein n=1 Tax=Armillaria gallica TaxID=47427 RepID=A0A2H3DXE6_ARMGA|nr:hypothetical protein ARMGADRAFT_1028314 [Armillaria gallica]